MIHAKLKPSLLEEQDEQKGASLASCLRGWIPPPGEVQNAPSSRKKP
jgi:hypothetical protein